MNMLKPCMLALSLAAMVSSALSVQAQELIQNGGFETQGTDSYDIVGWQVAEQGFIGGVLAQSGTVSEVTASDTAGAYQGNYYGMLDNYGLASSALYQTFSTAAVSSATLTFQMFVNNQAPQASVDATGLDYTTAATYDANQHVRVDVLKAGSTPFSTSSADILQTLYLGGANGASNSNPYLSYSFDISSSLSAGGNFVLRFASVANQNALQLGVDNVSIHSVSAVPEVESYGLMLTGLAMVGWMARRQKR